METHSSWRSRRWKALHREPLARLAALLVAWAVSHAITLFTRPWDDHTFRGVINSSMVVNAALAGILGLVASARSSGRARRAWAFIGLGFLSWAGGQAAWTFYELTGRDAPYPSAADLGYLVAPAWFVVGTVTLMPGRNWLRRSGSGLATAGIILLASAGVWHFLISPILNQSETSLLVRILTCAYPVSDLVILAILVIVLRAPRLGRARVVVATLAAGLLLFMASDFLYAYASLHDIYYTGHPIDFGWHLGFMVCAFAAALQARWRSPYPMEASSHDVLPISLTAVVLALFPVTFLLILAGEFSGSVTEDIPFLIMIGIVIVTATLRQAFTLVDNARLNHALARSQDELEARVERRTREVVVAESKFRSLSESAIDAILTSDAHGRLLSLNPAAEKMFQVREEEMVGTSLERLFPPRLRGRMGVRLRDALESGAIGGNEPAQVTAFRSDGSSFPAELSLASWREGDELYYGAIIRDVTERKRHEEQLQHFADVDGLTGLLNRRRLLREMELELAHSRRSGAEGALLFLDLDSFKGVNDNLGHHSGDDVLVATALILTDVLGDRAALVRLGGDEFAALLPNVDGETAMAIGQSVLSAIRTNRIQSYGQVVTVTASIGIALYPAHGTGAEELLVHADQAMYQAKERRDRVVMYSSAAGESGLTLRRPWEQRIREALERDQFILQYQPICDAAGDVTQYEALIRMLSDDGELILPGSFMEVAERTGLIHDIDRWVVCRAMEVIAEAERNGHPLRLEVNVSGRAFDDGELLPLVESALARTHIQPGSLVFEITETAAIADLDQARRFIEEVRNLGFRVALDDFGVGFSSFYALKLLPVDYLKIDGSFIRDLASDPVDQQLVRAIAQMASALGKQTIAEFVGDAPTVALLRRFGVDYTQGFHLGPPDALPARFTSPAHRAQPPAPEAAA